MDHEGPRQVCQSIELVQPELHESIDLRYLYQFDVLQESSLYSAFDLSFNGRQRQRETDRQRDRDRDRDRERQRQRERDRDRQTDRDRQRNRERDRERIGVYVRGCRCVAERNINLFGVVCTNTSTCFQIL